MSTYYYEFSEFAIRSKHVPAKYCVSDHLSLGNSALAEKVYDVENGRWFLIKNRNGKVNYNDPLTDREKVELILKSVQL